MVLTRRAYKSIARWLPNEIISEIIQAARPSDQAALCRTSKLFHALGVPILYRVVVLNGHCYNVIRFCSTVLANPSKFAGLVRSFMVDPKHDVDEKLYDSPLLSDCVKTLLKAEDISIDRVYLAKARYELLARTFPRLVRCTLSALEGRWTSSQEEDSVLSFLIRHPALETLHILSSQDLESWPSNSAQIPLLKLQRLRCPPRFLPSIIAPRLKEVELEWFALESDAILEETAFMTLRSLIPIDTPFVCDNSCLDRTCGEILKSASKHIPHIRTFQMLIFVVMSESPDETLAHFEQCLPSFTGLAYLSIIRLLPGSLTHDGRHVFEKNEIADQLAVQRLGDACPTMQACRLGAWRKVSATWEAFPVEDFVELAGITRGFVTE